MARTIRRARPEEAAELTALIFASKRSNGYDDAFMAACAEELRVTAEDIETKEVWVAADASVLGCVTLLRENARLGEVTSFFVHPDAKRQGVGRQLWSRVLSRSRDMGLTRLVLDADPEAVAFYEAMGFAVIGSSPSGSIPGRMLPQMALDL